jgi:hypothetical protein
VALATDTAAAQASAWLHTVARGLAGLILAEVLRISRIDAHGVKQLKTDIGEQIATC